MNELINKVLQTQCICLKLDLPLKSGFGQIGFIRFVSSTYFLTIFPSTWIAKIILVNETIASANIKLRFVRFTISLKVF